MNREKLFELMEQKKYVQLKDLLSETNPVDIAEILDSIESSITLLIFRMLPKDLAAQVFAHFSLNQKRDIINSVSDIELEYIMDELFFDDRIDLLEEMPANIVNRILINSDPEERNLINEFLKYPPDSAGSLMTIEYVELKKIMSVKEALLHLKRIGFNKETIYTCYVTDKNRILEGFVSLRKMVISEEEELIADLMKEDVIYVNTHDDQETVANVFRKYGFLALPVVDKEHRLTGIITVDDIMNVMKKEATEDFQRMAAMTPSEGIYLSTNVFKLAKHRIAWLLILMISAMITGGIISKYENLLESVVVLATFIPMLMDTGGNAGSQSSTLIIRGLATGELLLKDVWKILWKEFRISLIVGVSLAAINFARIMIFSDVGKLIAFTVSATLIVTIVSSKLLGGMLPLLAQKMKIDPAIMAGPLITTVVDGLSLVVYFAVASSMLNI